MAAPHTEPRPERVLTLRELNRATLARQLLLKRARLPVPRAIERLGALQAQWPPSPYVALWSRLQGFERAHLMRAVERRRVVKATLMRVTLHLVSAADYLSYAGLYNDARAAELRRRLERNEVEVDIEDLAAKLVRHTADAPRSRPELLALLEQPKLRIEDERPWIVWFLLAAHASLVHTPEAAVWRRNTAGGRFATARAWLGANPSRGDEAARHLVRRYLAAFGPAARADVAQWTGLPLARLEPAFETLPLRRFRDERDRVLWDLPRAPLPPADTPAPIRFLPMWDELLLAHDDRTRVLPDAYRRDVIRRNGDVQQTFLVGGVVAGFWRFDANRVEVEPFEPLPRRIRLEVEDEADALARFHE